MDRSLALNTLRFDADLCIGCGLCIDVCPHGVFAWNGSARRSAQGHTVRLALWEACMECGACQLNCPEGAILVESGVGCASAMIRAALTGKKLDERCT